eukprot:TRINITY_DN7442_c1_g1_i1.p1 TRINITY_DN7442_c1_g1~~TRINITY_DN7442_c1_g1_i1.p1  ORF type:complete len:653 (+),score=89.48 TRINITY_DN7442_c1_g1_i1:73-2031(+)
MPSDGHCRRQFEEAVRTPLGHYRDRRSPAKRLVLSPMYVLLLCPLAALGVRAARVQNRSMRMEAIRNSAPWLLAGRPKPPTISQETRRFVAPPTFPDAKAEAVRGKDPSRASAPSLNAADAGSPRAKSAGKIQERSLLAHLEAIASSKRRAAVPRFVDSCLSESAQGLARTPGHQCSPKHFIVDLDKPPEERWIEVAAHFGADKFLAAQLNSFNGIAHLRRLARVMCSFGFGSWKTRCAELRGYVNKTGEPLEDLIVLNHLYELTSGCTSVLAAEADGKVMHARTMDFAFEASLRKKTFTATLLKGGRRVAQITSFAGYLGVLTGVRIMRETGFAVSVNQRGRIDDLSTLFTNVRSATSSWMIGDLVRKVLVECEDFDCARNRLATTPLIAPVYFAISGSQANQGVILTREREGLAGAVVLSEDQPVIAQGNHDNWQEPPGVVSDDMELKYLVNVKVDSPSEACKSSVKDAMRHYLKLKFEERRFGEVTVANGVCWPETQGIQIYYNVKIRAKKAKDLTRRAHVQQALGFGIEQSTLDHLFAPLSNNSSTARGTIHSLLELDSTSRADSARAPHVTCSVHHEPLSGDYLIGDNRQGAAVTAFGWWLRHGGDVFEALRNAVEVPTTIYATRMWPGGNANNAMTTLINWKIKDR